MVFCFTLTGITMITAGRKNIDKKKAATTPIATVLPRSLNGGTSLKFMVKKPMAVVTLVIKTGCKLMRILSCMASALVWPCRKLNKNVTSICTQSATAIVVITVGALDDGPVKVQPSQPNMPMADNMDRMMTKTVDMVPVKERRSNQSVTIITINITGTKFFMSF